ncbi:GNAT family N-acetyltransferase [Vallicoccus soli]|uniref:Lysine N-acyltransferase MbtK n=1 Tax=Vallicoccus soli TaxID=2339232 RepID=A0A3A3Z3N0_9ACTN|nr:GNAT family N-acetyltransferase [Vallicoccus soli]RJK98024.1 N-acetyltransferase [Vallicoccus soli]
MTDARLTEGDHPFGDGRTLGVRRLDPARDAALVHAWVREERARFWGMTDRTVEQVREVYAFVDGLDTHHAYLLSLDGAPVGLLQTYQPAADPVGETYDVEPGDLGVHLLLAPAQAPESGFTGRLALALGAVVLAEPEVRRVVVEPDARNERALRRLVATGFELGPEVDLPTKRARLAFLRREVVGAALAAATAVAPR